ncbi:hypothetical protein HRbin15_00481 [bacterium HR15]|nr:hypothetical protein HRbin15_00481 [bacterium HR15]
MRYLAIDPGTQKAGVAIAELPDQSRMEDKSPTEPNRFDELLNTVQILHRAVLPLEELLERLPVWLEQYAPQRLLLGAGTGSKALLARLKERFPHLHWELVEERDTTLQARRLYFHFHPPRGWRRLLPMGLRIPPEPYDDYVALLLILRKVGLGG